MNLPPPIVRPLCVGVLLSLLAPQAPCETWRVAPGSPLSTIESAIDAAKPGDEIVVASGIYREHDLVLDKPLLLRGEPGAIIDGGGAGEILLISADGVTVRDLTLRNVGRSYTKELSAIHVSRSEDFSIENNTLENVFFGILVEKSSHGVIRGNTVSSQARTEATSGNGIHLWHCSDITIVENEARGLRDGMYFEFVDGSVIENNISHGNLRYGLHFMFSNHDEYRHNIFRDNGAGVAVMFSKFVTMRDNLFEKNWGSASYGLLLKEIYDSEVTNNIFNRNTIGVNVDSSTRIVYRNNIFRENGWAIKVIGACYENNYYNNDFLQNTFDISYRGRLNDNRFDGNYWSEYTGYDLNRDGIGDVPFRPVKLFSYIVNNTPETLVLLRSLFVDLINFSEKVSPAFTPDNLLDEKPSMRRINGQN